MRSSTRRIAVVGLSTMLSLGMISAAIAGDGRGSPGSVDAALDQTLQCEQVCALPQRVRDDAKAPKGKLVYALFMQSAEAAEPVVIDLNGGDLGL